MRVWLDDKRPAPASFTRHVLTAREAIDLLRTGAVTTISLDHDLGDERTCGSGYEVAVEIERLAHAGRIDPIAVFIHTQNPVGRQRMQAAVESAQRAWGRKTNNA